MEDRPSWDKLVGSMLPKPVTQQDGLIVGGEPGEVVVRISETEIAVAAFAIEWDSQEPRLAPEGWKTFHVTAKPELVAKAIIKARARRLGTYQWCPCQRSLRSAVFRGLACEIPERLRVRCENRGSGSE